MKLEFIIHVPDLVGKYLWRVAREEKCHPAKLVAKMITSWCDDELKDHMQRMQKEKPRTP